MKVLVEVPEEVTKIYLNNPNIGRKALIKEYGLSHHEARYIAWIMKNGKKIYYHDLKTSPESGKTQKAGVLPDIHFPYHDRKALDIAIDYCTKIGVDVLIIQGDGVDCYQISPWKTDPQRPIFAKEVEITKPLIQEIGEYFKDQEKIWIEGNHELRLRNLLWSKAKELAGLEALTIPEIYQLPRVGFNYVSNLELLQSGLEPFKIANLFILHGHEIKISSGAVNFAKLHYDKNPVTQVNAHHHQTQEYIIRKMDLKVDGSWVMGCLCDLNPDFAPANRWNSGFGIVEWGPDGYFEVRNKKIIDGRVL